MARKSRKESIAPELSETDTAYRAAIYVRLSVEDTHTRSSSIETQQLIIARFLEQNPDIGVYQTYIDNGASGMNFHRSGFQQMLADIEAGVVNCVIVKDLSRLGRNTIDTGYYIEQYFRIRNIRFIAVNENFDTAAAEDSHSGIIIPLRNMINEAYALDIGRKIKAQQRQAMKDGKYIGGRTPYGYVKDSNDCHQLVIDPIASLTVRQIFTWASEGVGVNSIAVRLNEAGCIPPSYYKREIGEITNDNLLGNGRWQTRTVNKILHSRVYIGDLAQGRTKSIEHRQIKVPESEWTVVQNTHEAIISRELFEKVQTILEKTSAHAKELTVKPYTPNILKGKIFCEDCGGNLHRQRNIRKKSDDVYVFMCLTQSRISKEDCQGVHIREDRLLDTITDMLINTLNTALGEYSFPGDESEIAERALLQNKFTERNREIRRLHGLVSSLYENLVERIITRDEYFTYKEQYEHRIAALNTEVQHLEEGVRRLDDRMVQYQSLSRDAEEIKANRKLTEALIERLIERIEVSHDKQITVKYRFQSEFETAWEVVEQCRNM